MHRKLLLFGALAGPASAVLPGYPAPVGAALAPRPPAMTPGPALALPPRDLDSCDSAASSITQIILQDAPTPGPALESFALFSPEALIPTGDACVDPVITDSDPQLQSELTSFASEYSSWQHKHICDFRKLFDECVTVPVASAIIFATDVVCSTFVEEIQSASCQDETTGDSSGSKPSTLTFTSGSSSSKSSTGTETGSSPESTATHVGGGDAAAHRTVALGAVLVGVLGFMLGH